MVVACKNLSLCIRSVKADVIGASSCQKVGGKGKYHMIVGQAVLRTPRRLWNFWNT
jgi:hypothetical protein